MKQSLIKTLYQCLIGLSVVCALLVATYTFAHETSLEPTTTPLDRVVVEEETRVNPEERRTERKTALDKNIQERIINLTRNVTDRLNAGIYRMENIVVRLESRITKMKAEGYTTETAEGKLREAQSTLRVAKTTLSESRPAQQAVSSDVPREAFREIRAQMQGVQELLRQTQSLLKETVALLRVSFTAGINTSSTLQAEENSTTSEPVDESLITQ